MKWKPYEDVVGHSRPDLRTGAVADEDTRRRVAANDRPLRSSAERLSDGYREQEHDRNVCAAAWLDAWSDVLRLLEYAPDYAAERASAVVSDRANLGIELPAAELLDLMPGWSGLLA
jgi:hypothetical protein